MIYKVIIPTKLAGLNEYISALNNNRFTGAKLKKDTEAVIRAYIKQQLPKGLKIPYKVSVHVEFQENQKRDFDNIESSIKFIMDSLVAEKIIANDNQRHTFPPTYTHTVAKAPKVIVTITAHEDIPV